MFGLLMSSYLRFLQIRRPRKLNSGVNSLVTSLQSWPVLTSKLISISRCVGAIHAQLGDSFCMGRRARLPLRCPTVKKYRYIAIKRYNGIN